MFADTGVIQYSLLPVPTSHPNRKNGLNLRYSACFTNTVVLKDLSFRPDSPFLDLRSRHSLPQTPFLRAGFCSSAYLSVTHKPKVKQDPTDSAWEMPSENVHLQNLAILTDKTILCAWAFLPHHPSLLPSIHNCAKPHTVRILGAKYKKNLIHS